MLIPRQVDVASVLDDAPVGRFRLGLTALCFVIMMVDGFDVQAMAYVAPAIARDWGIDVKSFGLAFGAGPLGLAIGALLCGSLADRIGRRAAILLCTIEFGLFTLATANATSIQSLIAYRLLAGIGLGGAVPNLVALVSEYAPRRLRATMLTIMLCGAPTGSILGGVLCSRLVPLWGWQFVFYAGGILPLMLAVVSAAWLPDSIRHLVLRGTSATEVAWLLNRITGEARYSPEHQFVLSEPASSGIRIALLFAEGRVLTTSLLWLSFFSHLLVLNMLINWLPVLFRDFGIEMDFALLSPVALNMGGLIGGLAIGRLMDRLGARPVLIFAFTSAGILLTLIVSGEQPAVGMLSMVSCIGAGIIGGHIGLNALAAEVYPTSIRGTGVGCAHWIGRLGSISGPVIGGWLLAAGWSALELLELAAIASLIAAVAVSALGLSSLEIGETQKAAATDQ